jgi:uncharacterized protein YuzE
MPTVRYDAEADVLYVEFGHGKVARTRALGDLRLVDEASDGSPLGIEFISASQGVNLSNLPRATEVERAIGGSGFSIPVLT